MVATTETAGHHLTNMQNSLLTTLWEGLVAIPNVSEMTVGDLTRLLAIEMIERG
jgi:hypothetical protein